MRGDGPIEKRIVLLGAGNTHLRILNGWRMDPYARTQLTLINDTLSMPYSGMIPGCIAGQYTEEEITIDIGRLCAAANVELVSARATAIDPEQHVVALEGRPPIRYDILSVNVGSRPFLPAPDLPVVKTLSLKPLDTLLPRLEAAKARLAALDHPARVIMVGSGAGGFEVCLALRRRWTSLRDASFEILTAGERILSGSASRVSARGERALAANGIPVRTDARVVGGDAEVLRLEDGDEVAYDLCIWATPARPLDLLASSNLERCERGFIRVHDTLQSISAPDVFAAGDCSTLESHPDLPKAGIFSVREGPVLRDNLRAALDGKALRPYRPQPVYLFLLNTADGRAIMNYSGVAAYGTWAFRWKNFIDRRWMRKFHDAYAEPMAMESAAEEMAMRCGGCGAKVGGQTLHRVLDRLDIPVHPDVLMGARPGDDAAVHRVPPGKLEVQSIDFFRAFISDPYLFGHIAALNALSDLYAMNAEPFSALAVVTVPYASVAVREEVLFQALSGALACFRAHGVTLTGGHTSESPEFQIGFSVTGYADENQLFRKAGLQPGDRLVLTKPLGSGALLRSHMLGQCNSVWYEHLITGLLTSNREASRILAAHSIRACTDITGFGFAGHLLEMLDGAGLSARIDARPVPLYAGFQKTAGRRGEGIVSTLHEENASVRNRVSGESPAWLFDPQTAGGLLAGVPPERVDAVLDALNAAGYTEAAAIGEVVAVSDGGPNIQLVQS